MCYLNGQKYSGTISSALSDIVRIDATKIKKSASITLVQIQLPGKFK